MHGAQQALLDTLRRRERQLAGKAATITRLRSSRDAARKQAAEARAEAAAAARRAERAIIAAGTAEAEVRQRAAEAATGSGTGGPLRQRDEEIAGLRNRLAEVAAVKVVPLAVMRQWQGLAAHIAQRQRAGSELTVLERDVLTTYRRHRAEIENATGSGVGASPRRHRRAAAVPAATPVDGKQVDA